MKPPTVFLGEMTDPEVEAFLATSQTVIVPTGSTEQHGPHAPLLTDRLIPEEVARRVAPRVRAVVAPAINYSLSYPHVGFAGVVHLRIPTFMAMVEDIAAGLAAVGFRRIVFLNGHYDNTYAIAYACANAAPRLPEGTAAFPVNYWDGMTADEAAEFFDPSNGLHANIEFPPFPEVTNSAPVHTAFFFSSPGSVHRATHSGTWGDPRGATAEFGERYLQVVSDATVRMLDDVERTQAAMPPR
jgi:creatinine amidohydrolase/Fe(II)-dependent formamide hydrolase-like protein